MTNFFSMNSSVTFRFDAGTRCMARRSSARANPSTVDRASGFAPYDSKAVPRFAPNFTVYVVPPDAVCLYSESRKFFLQGELYCALSSAIGAGGKSARQLVRELGHRFPTDKIHEALQRLFDRYAE